MSRLRTTTILTRLILTRLILTCLCVALGGVATANAQAVRPRVVAPAVPHPNTMTVMVRTALVALNNANLTGNYTVLRELAAPSFQSLNSAARLAEIFADLRKRNIDLGPVVLFTPMLTQQPKVSKQGLLRLVGYLPSNPERVNFDLMFQPVAERWRLLAIAVKLSKAKIATKTPATKPPATKRKTTAAKRPASVEKGTKAKTSTQRRRNVVAVPPKRLGVSPRAEHKPRIDASDAAAIKRHSPVGWFTFVQSK